LKTLLLVHIKSEDSITGAKVAKSKYNIGIVFGRERNGLTNEEMAMGDLRTVIPANEEYDVLNLAQAVNIMTYEFWQRKLELEKSIMNEVTSEFITKDESSSREEVTIKERDRLANRDELFHYLEMLFAHLDSGDIFPTSKSSRQSTTEVDDLLTTDVIPSTTEAKKPFSKKDLLSLSTVYQRARLTKGEVSLFFGVLKYLTAEKKK